MKSTFILFTLLFGVSFSAFAQAIEENIKVVYMQANVLYDTERYDEAVRMYNQVLNKDDEFAPAFLMRAKSKYALAAYKGAKSDVLDYFDINGVTKDAIKLMTRIEFKLDRFKAAKNYALTAVELDPYDAEQILHLGNIEYELDDKTQACEYWFVGSSLGNIKAKTQVNKHCENLMAIKEMNEKTKQKRERERNRKKEVELEDEEDDMGDLLKRPKMDDDDDIVGNRNDEDIDMDDDMDDDNEKKSKKRDKVVIESADMDAIQEVEIDEDLSVIIGNGLGKRKLEDHPDIFMLSNESGKVVIDICVNNQGKVTSAELNKDQSDILKPGLTSLAIRKSKEFQFFTSFRDEQCGFLIYMIK